MSLTKTSSIGYFYEKKDSSAPREIQKTHRRDTTTGPKSARAHEYRRKSDAVSERGLGIDPIARSQCDRLPTPVLSLGPSALHSILFLSFLQPQAKCQTDSHSNQLFTHCTHANKLLQSPQHKTKQKDTNIFLRTPSLSLSHRATLISNVRRPIVIVFATFRRRGKRI